VFFYFFDVCGFLSYQGVGFRAAMYSAVTQPGWRVGGDGQSIPPGDPDCHLASTALTLPVGGGGGR